jgi:hypothetical protein
MIARERPHRLVVDKLDSEEGQLLNQDRNQDQRNEEEKRRWSALSMLAGAARRTMAHKFEHGGGLYKKREKE